jgi:hypothetical protein
VHSFVAVLVLGPVVLGVSEDIVNVHNTTLDHGTARRRASIAMDGVLFDDILNKFIRMAEAGRSSINVAILSLDETPFGVAQTDSFLQKILQH